MSTGNDIITAALEEIGYKGAETPIEPEDAAIALRKMNDMLIEWDNSGINLGYNPIVDLADTVRIPRGAENAVIMNLGLGLAVPFRVALTAEFAASAKSASTNMIRGMVKLLDVDFPSTLPIGSGNYCAGDDADGTGDNFFAEKNTENF